MKDLYSLFQKLSIGISIINSLINSSANPLNLSSEVIEDWKNDYNIQPVSSYVQQEEDYQLLRKRSMSEQDRALEESFDNLWESIKEGDEDKITENYKKYIDELYANEHMQTLRKSASAGEGSSALKNEEKERNIEDARNAMKNGPAIEYGYDPKKNKKNNEKDKKENPEEEEKNKEVKEGKKKEEAKDQNIEESSETEEGEKAEGVEDENIEEDSEEEPEEAEEREKDFWK